MAVLSITNPKPISLLLRANILRGETKGFDGQGGEADPGKAGQAYVLNLAKLIPGDIIALYTLLGQLKPPAACAPFHINPFLCCLVLVIVRAFATKPPKAGPRWLLVLISLLTFICWIYAQKDWFWTWEANEFGTYIANAGLLTFAFIAPAFLGEDD